MLLILTATTASAKEVGIDDCKDFDTQNGCINVNNPDPKGGVFCIDISEGEGTIKVGKFYTIEISFWYYTLYNYDYLTFTFVDSAETGNYLSVTFHISNSENLNVKIKDGLKSGDDDDLKTHASRQGYRKEMWLKGEISLKRTDKGTDGVTKWVDVKFDEELLFDKYVITQSPGVFERFWNQIEVDGDGDSLYTDEIKVSTGRSKSWGLTYAFIALGGVSIYAIIATKYDIWPFKRTGIIRTNLRRLT